MATEGHPYNLAKLMTNAGYDVIVAGAGPAGSSASIHLAREGFRVLLVEQKKFPRPKLCGEFISPECKRHFEKLGVAEAMMDFRPATLTETVFYSTRGHHVTVPSSWFGGTAAFGLSRAVMDDVLLRRAQECGVTVLERATILETLLNVSRKGAKARREDPAVSGVKLKIDGREEVYEAPVTIDATGRARILSRKLNTGQPRSKAKLIAFKAHLRKARVADNTCEIYFYPEGYGGLSSVEGEVSNLCFIISAEQVRRHYSNPDAIVRDMVMKNRRAAYTLEHATTESDWLSASWESFGQQEPCPATGLLAVGDSASFIDPFTGSGMLMAFESGELVADVLSRHHGKLDDETVGAEYTAAYVQKFNSRLRICGLLRRAAFKPRLAGVGIAIGGLSERLLSRIARATRSTKTADHSPLRAG